MQCISTSLLARIHNPSACRFLPPYPASNLMATCLKSHLSSTSSSIGEDAIPRRPMRDVTPRLQLGSAISNPHIASQNRQPQTQQARNQHPQYQESPNQQSTTLPLTIAPQRTHQSSIQAWINRALPAADCSVTPQTFHQREKSSSHLKRRRSESPDSAETVPSTHTVPLTRAALRKHLASMSSDNSTSVDVRLYCALKAESI